MSTILEKIKSVKLCLMAHPDNEQDSEFADRISDLEEIEIELLKDKWIKIEDKSDLPKNNNLIWVIIEDLEGCINVQPDISNDDYYGSDGVIYHGRHITHYQQIIEPDLPTI